MTKIATHNSSERPKFLPSFLAAVKEEAERRGWMAVFPYVLISTALIASAIAYFLPATLWAKGDRELAVAVYVGLLTFNGLILALGWAAFSRIYDVLLRGDFGKYLMQSNLLNNYILQITFMHMLQAGAVVASMIGVISVLLDGIPVGAERVIFAGSLALTLYAIKQALDAVTAMNDLVWQSAFFENHRSSVSNNVIPVRAERS